MRIKVLILLSLLMLAPCPASIFKTGESVGVGSNEVIDQNIYLAGNLININGEVDGDVITLGNVIIINGLVSGDLLAAANSVTVNGNVTGDVRTAGSIVMINGEVGGEVLAGVGQLIISEDSSVAEVNAGAGSIIISGAVIGNVTAVADNVTVTDKGIIGGVLNYTSSNKAEIADENSISLIQQNEPKNGRSWSWTNMLPISYLGIALIVFSVLSKLLTGFILTRISKNNIKELKERMNKEFLNQSIIGFAVMILVPIAAIIGLVTIIALPLILVALGLYLITLYLASVTAAFFVGSKALELLKVDKQSLTIELFIGVLIIELINWVPFIGWVFNFIILLFSLGALTNLLKNKYADAKKKKIL